MQNYFRMFIPVDRDNEVKGGIQKVLLNGNNLDAHLNHQSLPLDIPYDVSSNGDRFLLIQNQGPVKTSLVISDNWLAKERRMKETL